jgi:hypothetical protein
MHVLRLDHSDMIDITKKTKLWLDIIKI